MVTAQPIKLIKNENKISYFNDQTQKKIKRIIPQRPTIGTQ